MLKVHKDQYGNPYVFSVFGKSIYNEPIMLSTYIKGMRMVTTIMP